MRVLTILTIAMGALILLGTTVLVVAIIERGRAPSPAREVAVELHEPAGTRIAAIAGVADRLALELQGGGPDRVVLVDPRSGMVAARIALGR
jgi:hypothetical protein